jgi:hypothetical protein
MSGRGFVDFFLIVTYRNTDTQTECSFISIDIVVFLINYSFGANTITFTKYVSNE